MVCLGGALIGAPSSAGAQRAAYANPGTAEMSKKAPEHFRARFETSVGAFTVEVTRAWSPRGADRFYNFIRTGYYDGQRFFRVRKGFIVQWGLHGDPAVIAEWKNAVLPDEPRMQSNARGTIAYAFTTAGTRSTQIFISTGENARLDAEGFAPFGRVINGMDVVDRIFAEYDENSGGGMRTGKQGALEAGGNAWLAANWPKLDYIKQARIVAK
jgi:homoserine O-acetyltransferase